MSSSNVEKIKERLGIADVVGSYIKLEKAGTNFKAKCPFHNEKTPSFFISPDRGTYHCFGCNAGGDIFSFVQEFEGLDFYGALKVLASRAGVTLQAESREAKTEKDRLLSLMEAATKFFENELSKESEVLKYIAKRGISKDTQKKWRIGYAPSDWRLFLNHAKKLGFQEDEIRKAGLIKKSLESGDFYDVFRGRIIFPLFDNAARPIAFSGRLFVEKQDAPKYLNSPETILFNKSEVLYGFHDAKTEIRKKNYTVLVEGQIDLVLSHQAGFSNTVATSGTALTLSQLQKLNRMSDRIIFAYDGDSAGFKALERSAKLALSLGMNIKVATVPPKEDPASIICKNSKDWLEILKKSSNIIDFYLDKISGAKLDSRKQDREVRQKVLPLLKLIPSNIDQARFVSQIAEKLGIRESAVWDDLKKIQIENEILEEEPEDKNQLVTRKSSILNKLFGIIFWQENSEENVKISSLEEDLERVLGKEDFENNLRNLEWKKSELIFEAESYFTGSSDLHKIYSDLILNLEEEILREKFALAMSSLNLAEKEKDEERIKNLLVECSELSEQINNLNFKKTKTLI